MHIPIAGVDTPENEKSRAEMYIEKKGWRYRNNGDQINVEKCPLPDPNKENSPCLAEYKLYINRNTFQYKCHKCGNAGNEWKMRTALGDTGSIGAQTTNGGTGGEQQQQNKEPEPMPDYMAAHQALLADDEVMNYLNDERGWTPEIIDRMKLGVEDRWFKDKGKIKCVVYPYVIDGEIKFAKWRTLPPAKKDFRVTQGHDNPLYNQDAIKKGMEYAVFVEGEADTLSALTNGEEHVAGIPGADSKKATWAKLLDYPQKKYLIFDNDEKGQDGAYNFALRFGIEGFYNIVLPKFTKADGTEGKDLTEWYAAGHTKEELDKLKEDATLFAVSGITSAEDAISASLCQVEERGSVAPRYQFECQSLNTIVGGYDKGHLIGVTGPGGSGKTTAVLNELDHQADLGAVCYFLCLEMEDSDMAKKLVARTAQLDMSPFRGTDLIEKALFDKALAEKYKVASRFTLEKIRNRKGKLLFGSLQVTKIEEVFANMEAAYRRYGVDIFAFDNLQLLVDTVNRNPNFRTTMMSSTSKQFKRFMAEHKTAGFLIAQPKKLLDGQMARAGDADGSGAFEKDVDFSLSFFRNRDERLRGKTTDIESVQNMHVEQAMSPILLAYSDKTRYAPGGLVKLYLDGGRSTVREINENERGDKVLVSGGGIAVAELPQETI